VEEVLAVLNGNPMPETWNDTFIVLIPKVKNPDKVKDLQPISFYVMCYTNWYPRSLIIALKKSSRDHFSFLECFYPRVLTDNVLLVYELTHHLRNRRKGKEGWLPLNRI